MTSPRDSVAATGLVLLGASTTQVGSALATHLFASIGVTGVVTARLLIASAVLAVALGPGRLLRRLSREQWLSVALFGASVAGMNWFFYLAIDRVPIGMVVTIEFLGPLGLALAGSRRLPDLFWAVLALGGVALLTGFHLDALDPWGLVLTVLGGIGWVLYILASRRLSRAFDGLSGMALGLAFGAALMIPVGIAAHTRMTLTWPVVLAVAGIAVLSTLVPQTTDVLALRRIPPSTYGIIVSLDPAVSALAGMVLLRQTMTLSQWAGIGMVVLASAGSTVLTAPRGAAGAPAAGTVSDVVPVTTRTLPLPILPKPAVTAPASARRDDTRPLPVLDRGARP